MAYRCERSDARPWSEDQLAELFAEGFPAFVTADREVKRSIGRVREDFAALNLMLVDQGDRPVATGWGIPIAWSGHVDTLPATFAGVLDRAVELFDAGEPADTLVICGAVVHPERKGPGAADALLQEQSATAARAGLTRVLAPVRPTRKHLYPLIPIAEYAAWVRADGLPFDPWLRLHVRLGGRVIGIAEEAQTMIGTVAQWQTWTGLALPASGMYVIPQGLSVLAVDTSRDEGVYVEPNIWVRHR